MQSRRLIRGPVATFIVAVGVMSIGAVVGLHAIPTVGVVVGLLGGGFALGLVTGTRPLVTGATAAALVQLGVLAWAGVPGARIMGAGSALGAVTPQALVSALLFSIAAGGFGTHLGDDLRDGLTKPIESHRSKAYGTQQADTHSTTHIPAPAQATTKESETGEPSGTAEQSQESTLE